MKKVHAIAISVLFLCSSCMIVYNAQKTYPPELNLFGDSTVIAYANFYDYTVREDISDKEKTVYSACVRGFMSGMEEVYKTDSTVKMIIADTLVRGYTVISMQDSTFRDTIILLCRRYDADMLIILDSVEIWMEEDAYYDDDGNGSTDYFLCSGHYATLYSCDGEVLDRSMIESSVYYKTRQSYFGGLLSFSPSMSRAAKDIYSISYGSGKDYAGKFYPTSESVIYNLYTGKAFEETNRQIMEGNPVMAIDALRSQTASPKLSLAKKAAHNLSVIYEILDHRREKDQIYTDLKEKKEE